MYIKSLSIRNFRNFKAAKFNFLEGSVNTILGENASGKTNVFHALRLVLDDSLPLNSRYLSTNDFNHSLGVPKGHWIVIELTFGRLGASDEELVLVNHALEGDEVATEGTYCFVFRPKHHVRKKMHEISVAEPDKSARLEAINEYLQTILIDKKDYEAVGFTRTAIDFSDENTYKNFAGDFESGVFPDPDNEDAAFIGAMKPAYFSLIREVTCTYVKALRNVVNDLKYAKTNPLSKLLSYKSEEIDGAEDITDSVKKLNKDISDLDQVKSLSGNISKTLSDAVGQTYSPSINISSDLPEEISELVQSLSLIVEDSIGYKGTGNIEDLSLGGANLIYLALKLHEYEMRQEKDDKIAHFLLIEEPEAHIHNHIQKTLFSNFSSYKTQVFVSTHSTQMSSVSKISSMNMISRREDGADVFWPSSGLSPEEINGIERYLDAVRSTLLFAKSIVLVEGDAEKILIPKLIKEAFGISLDEMGVSLVSVDGTVFSHISKLFHEDRIRNYCAILTDLDAPFLEEKTEYADEDYIKGLINAGESGALRQNDLLDACKDNEFLSSFFAQNTFETELILSNNKDLFINVLPKVYKQKSRIDEWTELLNSADSPRLCHASLYLAKKVGKGWFAIQLAESVTADTNIPQYIIEAICHALKGHQREPIYRKIMAYRLKRVGRSLDGIMQDVDGVWESCVDVYTDILPEDPLCKLMDVS